MDMSNRVKELTEATKSAYRDRHSKTLFRDHDIYNRCATCGVEKGLMEKELSHVIAQLEKFQKLVQGGFDPNDEDLKQLITEYGEKRVELEIAANHMARV